MCFIVGSIFCKSTIKLFVYLSEESTQLTDKEKNTSKFTLVYEKLLMII